MACDYVINGWLAEMAVGDSPDSALYDSSLRGKSAEEVYDQIAAGRRRTWKLATLRGPGACDILPARLARPGDQVCGVDLDEFYRRCLVLRRRGARQRLHAPVRHRRPGAGPRPRRHRAPARRTVLQPGVDLLRDAPDFPRDGPILVITDAWIDRVRIKREHAYLIPAGAVLPFPARGPVFRFS